MKCNPDKPIHKLSHRNSFVVVILIVTRLSEDNMQTFEGHIHMLGLEMSKGVTYVM